MAGDYGQKIAVDFKGAEIQADKDMGANERFLLGYVSMAYDVDEDFELVIYFKRDNGMSWQSLDPFTVSKNEKRFFMPLEPGLVVIDAYPRFYGEFKSLLVSSCKLHLKPQRLGKFGG